MMQELGIPVVSLECVDASFFRREMPFAFGVISATQKWSRFAHQFELSS